MGIEDIGIPRKLSSELRGYGLCTGPVLAHFVNADQLQPGRRIISRRRACTVDRIDGFRPFLLGYVGVGNAQKGGTLIGVFGQQIVIERSRLVRSTRRRVNLRQVPCGDGEVRVDRRAARNALSAAE